MKKIGEGRMLKMKGEERNWRKRHKDPDKKKWKLESTGDNCWNSIIFHQTRVILMEHLIPIRPDRSLLLGRHA